MTVLAHLSCPYCFNDWPLCQNCGWLSEIGYLKSYTRLKFWLKIYLISVYGRDSNPERFCRKDIPMIDKIAVLSKYWPITAQSNDWLNHCVCPLQWLTKSLPTQMIDQIIAHSNVWPNHRPLQWLTKSLRMPPTPMFDQITAHPNDWPGHFPLQWLIKPLPVCRCLHFPSKSSKEAFILC